MKLHPALTLTHDGSVGRKGCGESRAGAVWGLKPQGAGEGGERRDPGHPPTHHPGPRLGPGRGNVADLPPAICLAAEGAGSELSELSSRVEINVITDTSQRGLWMGI